MGVITDGIAASAGGQSLATTLGITVEQLGMKCGMLLGMLFPLIAIFLYLHLLRTQKRKLYRKKLSAVEK